jgi:hypothetical protein
VTLSAIVNGVTYPLDDGTYCYWIGDDGLGMAPMHRLSERGPLQHGDTDRGYRLDPRMIRLVLDIVAETRAEMFSKRASLLGIFSPVNNKIILQMQLDARTYRLDVNYIAQMAMPSSERLGWNQTLVIDLKANDPTWYKSVGSLLSFSLGAGGDSMEVPTVIPMTVGGSTINATTQVVNNGTFYTYPTIRINGPIENFVITNNTSGKKLDFTGVSIGDGDYYEINLSYGYKTIVNAAGTNKIADLTGDSDLSTWNLLPIPDAVDGINSIKVVGISASEKTNIYFRWYERYIGI